MIRTAQVFRGVRLPIGMTAEMARDAERAIARWEQDSRLGVPLALELFAIFRGPEQCPAVTVEAKAEEDV